MFQSGQHIHFVGMGGFGLSAIARVLLERGFSVSGSDRTTNALTDALQRDGATIFAGHAAQQVHDADLLIVSSAVPADNPEVVEAQARGIPVYKRINVLAPLMAEQRVVAVAGTHGKTTTTAMITHLLRETGHDPTYIVGGVLGNTGTNAGVGQGDSFVIEADEYDHAFLGLYPELAVITNVEHDHPDFFKTEADLQRAFEMFAARLSRDHGVMIACADDPGALRLAQARREKKQPAFTYGFSEHAALRAVNIEIDTSGVTTFDVVLTGRSHGRASLTIPGRHNIQNALAALYVAGPGHDQSLAGVMPHLSSFQGTGRRFEVRVDRDGIAVVDDYAHHPTAIRATLAAARARYPERTLWAVWQPHTYSRTQTLMDDFAGAFELADGVLVTDIYAARETPIPGVSGSVMADKIVHSRVRHTPSLEDATTVLLEDVQSPAIILIMSAGTAPQIGIEFVARYFDEIT